MADNLYKVNSTRIELLLDQRARTVQTIRIEYSTDLISWATMASVNAKDQPPSGGGIDTAGYRGKVFYRFDPSSVPVEFPFYLRFIDVSGFPAADTATSDILTVTSHAMDLENLAAGLTIERHFR